MTKQESIKYAVECKKAKKAGLPKPERPDASSLAMVEAAAKLSKRNLKTTEHRLKVIIDQSMYIMDFFDTVVKDNPEMTVYQRIQDAICNSLYELSETIKYI